LFELVLGLMGMMGIGMTGTVMSGIWGSMMLYMASTLVLEAWREQECQPRREPVGGLVLELG
jgi:hypothetical protein